ncbi:hypothetical protein Landi51_13006 [Colletotrichum acutatum]
MPLAHAIRSSIGGKRRTTSKVHQGGKGKTMLPTKCGHRIAPKLPVTFVSADFKVWTDEHEYLLLYHNFLHKKPVASINVSQLKFPNFE